MDAIFPTPIEPSRICLGTASFGSDFSKETAFEVMDAFLEYGGNFIDTAHVYAAWREGYWGASERTVGEWLESRGCRHRIVLATKGGHPPLDDLDHGRCGRDDLERDLAESQERLGVACVDVYWLHRDDPARPVGEIVDTLATFVDDGRIRSFGGSNWTSERLEAANAYADTHGLPRFVASQPGWAFAYRASDEPPVPGMLFLDEAGVAWHRKTGFPMAAYTAQAKGYFSVENATWARLGFSGPVPHGAEYDSTESRKRLLAARSLAQMKGCTTSQIALAYLLHQSFPVFPIIGSSKVDRIHEALGSLDVGLDASDLQVLTL